MVGELRLTNLDLRLGGSGVKGWTYEVRHTTYDWRAVAQRIGFVPYEFGLMTYG